MGGLVTRWTQKLTDFNSALNAYDGLPGRTSDADRFAALQAAELIVIPTRSVACNSRTVCVPRCLPRERRSRVASHNFRRFKQRGNILSQSLLFDFCALSTAEFDSQPFDVSAVGDGRSRSRKISRALYQPIVRCQHAHRRRQCAATDGGLRCFGRRSGDCTHRRRKALLGDDFQIVPEFTVSAAQGAEWANAVNASNSGDLFTYLKTTLQDRFSSRRMVLWRGASSAAAALLGVGADAGIRFRPDAAAAHSHTIAVRRRCTMARAAVSRQTAAIDSDRLLYTCLYSQPFSPAARQCGLLVDEWTEVIPATKRDTGITFNYDRPDNEPPQSHVAGDVGVRIRVHGNGRIWWVH